MKVQGEQPKGNNHQDAAANFLQSLSTLGITDKTHQRVIMDLMQQSTLGDACKRLQRELASRGLQPVRKQDDNIALANIEVVKGSPKITLSQAFHVNKQGTTEKVGEGTLTLEVKLDQDCTKMTSTPTWQGYDFTQNPKRQK